MCAFAVVGCGRDRRPSTSDAGPRTDSGTGGRDADTTDDAGSLAIAPDGMRSPRGVTLPRRASLAVLVAAMVLALMCIEWIATQRGRLQ